MKTPTLQPESSEREDYTLIYRDPETGEISPVRDLFKSENLAHDFVTVGCTDHRFCTKCGEEDHVVKHSMMRCSELYGKIET
jgi:hypothetical protein